MRDPQRQSKGIPRTDGQGAARAGSAPTTSLDWPVAERVPVTIITEGRTWRDPFTTHHLDAAVPPFIAALPVALPVDLAAKVTAAERALADLDAQLDSSDAAIVEAATFALLRSESVSSSRIEGIAITNRRLAEAIHDAGSAKHLAREVVGNIDAMRAAVDAGTDVHPFTPEDIADLHRLLMARSIGITEGEYREEQNWIGAERVEDGVAYVPPPPGLVPELLEDLCDFIETSPTSAVVRAALAHSQFEAIHPFGDGNGRVGRCITSVTLRKAGGTATIPPVSSVLLTDTDAYFAALREYQQNADPGPWIGMFADAIVEACARARTLVADIEAIKADWRERTGARRGTHLMRLIETLPTQTITTAEQVAARLEIDPNQARRLLTQLERAGIVKQVSDGKRNRVWRVDQMLRLLDDHSLGRT